MYAKLILRFKCYNVELGMLCRLYIFVVRIFLRSKPSIGAQRQVSMMCGLLMCDVLDVHISDMCHYMIIKYDVWIFVGAYMFDVDSMLL
jgi:hypothetical protein